jgi:regulator of protease activity HflC (stomatin/prohibitin superfamily)
MNIVVIIIVAFILVVIATMSIYTVRQQYFAIIERFGKYVRTSGPGIHFKIPLVENVAGRISIRVQELNVKISTKTKDNVFVNLLIAVQYFVPDAKNVWNAFYKLADPHAQMESYVYDTVRAKVPTMNLDDVFEKKEEIAQDIEEKLKDIMPEFGFSIKTALVNDIQPDQGVADAMNEINKQQRLRIAATDRGEAEKILVVKAAEADAESKKLSGQGIADQRKAIVEGLKESIKETSDALGVDTKEVMTLVFMTQYYDMLTDIGRNSQTNTIMLSHTPSAIGDIKQEIMSSLLAAKPFKQEK